MSAEYLDMLPPNSKNNFELGEDLNVEDIDSDEKFFEMLGIPKDIGPDDPIADSEFYDNLCYIVDDDWLMATVNYLVPAIEDDKESRSPKDERVAQTNKRLGYTDKDIMGGADFQGASKVTHPLLSEMINDTVARAIKEICPPQGPVKINVVGDKDDSRLINESHKKKDYLNLKFRKEIRLRNTLETLLSQYQIAGSGYIKSWWDEQYKELRCDFVPLDQIYIPFTTKDFYRSKRLTHIIKYTDYEFEEMIDNGVYMSYPEDTLLDFDSNTYGETLYSSKTEKVRNDQEGKDEDGSSDGFKVIYECQTFLRIEDDKESKGKLAPYIVSIDAKADRIISVYRNWAWDDKLMKPLKWIVEYRYLPWTGAYGVGLAEIFDSIEALVTGSSRALIDAANGCNFPPMAMLKSATITGQNRNPRPGEMMQIDAGLGAENVKISDLIQALPISNPSPVLMELMQYYDQKGQSFQTNLNGVMDTLSNGDAPVGTAMALLEENNKKYAAIHARLHGSMEILLEVVCRIIHQNMPPEIKVKEMSGTIITRDMFDDNSNMIPVSDPNIFCDAQRYAQIQTALQMAQNNPQMFNLPELYMKQLQLMNFPDYNSILNIPQSSGKLNPVAENYSVFSGISIQAYPEQDHLSHIQCHIEFLEDQMFGANPLASSMLQPMVAHIQQHLGLLYTQMFKEALMKNKKEYDFMKHEGDAIVDKELTELNKGVLMTIGEVLQPYVQRMSVIVQRMQQAAQANQPQDPNMIKAQADQQKVQIEGQKAQSDAQIAQQEQQNKQQQLALDQQKLQADTQKSQWEHQEKLSGIQNSAIKDADSIKIEQMRLKQTEVKAASDLHVEMLRMAHDQLDKATDRMHDHVHKERDRASTLVIEEGKHGLERSKIEAQKVAQQNKPKTT